MVEGSTLRLVVLLACFNMSLEKSSPMIEILTLLPAEWGTCSGAFIQGTKMRLEWRAHGLQEGDHVEVYLGHGQLSGVNLCYRFEGGDCNGESRGNVLGHCPLHGSLTLQLNEGMHVAHLLLVTRDGHPVGPHETVLLHMPEAKAEDDGEIDFDEYDEAEAFDFARCGRGTELAFVELARQCERHLSYEFAEKFYACAARQARNNGRTSAHATVGLYGLYDLMALPAGEDWRREQAQEAVGALTDGITSVSERWSQSSSQARAPPEYLHAKNVLHTPVELSKLNITVEGVRGVSLSEFFGRQICGMDCLALESCYDSALYFLEFSRIDNHYRLLKYITSHMNNALIVDLGTHGGGSSLALASNTHNRVVSFDLDGSHLTSQALSCGLERAEFTSMMHNVEYVVGDALALRPELLLSADLVLIDTAHEGGWEEAVLQHLLSNGFAGLVLLDDIHANMAMELLWAGIPLPKWDLTRVGHAPSGTGLIDFSSAPSTRSRTAARATV